MKDDTTGLGSRLRFVRERWHLTPEALSNRSGDDAATIRQVEAGAVEPDSETAQRLADALCIYAQWLQDADIPMVPLSCMAVDEQVQSQTGPGTEGLPGFVIVEPGPWEQDERGEWHVDPSAVTS